MRVGFAGLGRMGTHMARNLVAAGHDVAVWTRNPKILAQFCQDIGSAGLCCTIRVKARVPPTPDGFMLRPLFSECQVL